MATGIGESSLRKRDKNQKGWRLIAILGAALLIGSSFGWAGATVFGPSQGTLESESVATVVVTQGEVGSSLSLNTVATWEAAPVALNGASGVVTSVDISAGDRVEQGQQLYGVELRPVVVGQGAIPGFGSIAPGDTGDQVAQLQTLLSELSYWGGESDGRYTAAFEDAVRTWQREAGFPEDGIVQAGDIVWIPELPSRMSLEMEIIGKGLTVQPGAGQISVFGKSPTFRIPMTRDQASSVPIGTRVLVRAPDGSTWEGVTGSQSEDENSVETILVELHGADGGALCADLCDLIGAEGEVSLQSEIVTVPVESGLIVPASAVATSPSGQAFVLDAEGVRHEVTVVQSARGMALVEGVAEGLEVRVLAEQGA